MSEIATAISAAVRAAEAIFAECAVTVFYGDNFRYSAAAMRSSARASGRQVDLGGVEEGLRGRIVLLLARCGDNDPPGQGDKVQVRETDGTTETVTVLNHTDDPTLTVRTLYYGEETA